MTNKEMRWLLDSCGCQQAANKVLQNLEQNKHYARAKLPKEDKQELKKLNWNELKQFYKVKAWELGHQPTWEEFTVLPRVEFSICKADFEKLVNEVNYDGN